MQVRHILSLDEDLRCALLEVARLTENEIHVHAVFFCDPEDVTLLAQVRWGGDVFCVPKTIQHDGRTYVLIWSRSHRRTQDWGASGCVGEALTTAQCEHLQALLRRGVHTGVRFDCVNSAKSAFNALQSVELPNTTCAQLRSVEETCPGHYVIWPVPYA